MQQPAHTQCGAGLDYRQLTGLQGRSTRMLGEAGEQTVSTNQSHSEINVSKLAQKDTQVSDNISGGRSSAAKLHILTHESELDRLNPSDNRENVKNKHGSQAQENQNMNGTTITMKNMNGPDSKKKGRGGKSWAGSTASRKTTPSQKSKSIVLDDESAAEFNNRLEQISESIDRVQGTVALAYAGVEENAHFLEDKEIPKNLEDGRVWEETEQAHRQELMLLNKTLPASKRRDELMALKAQIVEKRQSAYLESWNARLEDKHRLGENTYYETKRAGTLQADGRIRGKNERYWWIRRS